MGTRVFIVAGPSLGHPRALFSLSSTGRPRSGDLFYQSLRDHHRHLQGEGEGSGSSFGFTSLNRKELSSGLSKLLTHSLAGGTCIFYFSCVDDPATSEVRVSTGVCTSVFALCLFHLNPSCFVHSSQEVEAMQVSTDG